MSPKTLRPPDGSLATRVIPEPDNQCYFLTNRYVSFFHTSIMKIDK